MSTATDYKHRAQLPINAGRDGRRMRRRLIGLLIALAAILMVYGVYQLWPSGGAPEAGQAPQVEMAPVEGAPTTDAVPSESGGVIRHRLKIDPKPLPSAPVAPPASGPAPAPPAAAPEEPYAFYHLLRDYEVLIPAQDLPPPPKKTAAAASMAPIAVEKTAPAPVPRKAAASVPAGGTYLLQVGSFRTTAQADRLKARLASLGFEAAIHSARVNDAEVWYRVRIGPYRDPHELSTHRRRLEESGLKPIAVKLTR